MKKTLEFLDQDLDDFSSVHQLFLPEDECHLWVEHGYAQRFSHQYHWHNKDYKSFTSFLDSLKVKRAKEIKRERKSIVNQEIVVERIEGDSITPDLAPIFYRFYLSTLDKKRGIPYLTEDFFRMVFISMKDRILLCMAKKGDQWVGGSISFKKGSKLFGRYWGCTEELKNLHFELCYYQPIEYCIENELVSFEAGAQGRHKIQRGFTPTWTYSCHRINHPQFSNAISSYIQEEKKVLDEIMAEDSCRQPFR